MANQLLKNGSLMPARSVRPLDRTARIRANATSSPVVISRRQLAELAMVGTGAFMCTNRPARAEARDPLRIEDFDYTFQAPESGFKFVAAVPPKLDRGPAPERSPVRARLDSTDGASSLSVIVRSAQAVKFTLVQISDVSLFGTLEEAAKLLLPRGSVVTSASTETFTQPPRETPLGMVDIPPKTYYRYELTTYNGSHVFLSVAAQRGQVYVCSGQSTKDAWETVRPLLVPSVLSFRLKENGALGPRSS